MSTEVSIGIEDVVVAKDKAGKRYYVAGQTDDTYTSLFHEDPIGRCITWHRRYSIGTKHNYADPSDFWVDVFNEFYNRGDTEEECRENDKKFCSLLWSCARMDVVPREKLKVEDVFHKDLKAPYYLCRLDMAGDVEWEGDWYPLSTNNIDEMTQEDLDSFWHCLEQLDLYEYELLARKLDDFAFSRVYMYEHSGRVYSLGDFCDKWDSGCLGVFCCTKEEFTEKYPLTAAEDWKKKFLDYAEGVLEEWNAIERGDVWGFAYSDADQLDSCKDVIYRFAGAGMWVNKLSSAVFSNHIDSCWGFVGEYDDMIREFCFGCNLEIVDVVKN